jgi:ABC-type Fe3+-hydroxamate transport system substrate-binding protein
MTTIPARRRIRPGGRVVETPGWQHLRAAENHRVYVNPQGLYPWDRFGPTDADLGHILQVNQ